MIHALSTLVLLVFPVMVILAGLKDVTSYTIPNWMPLGLIAGFPLAALAAHLPLPVVGLHAAVGVAALFAGMGMFAVRWIGGGDAKLFAAAALWIGWPAAMTYLLVTTLAGGALAVLLVGLRSARLRPALPSGPAWLVRLAAPGENVPYGVAIAIGALAAWPLSTLAAAH
jgi:prepilin peptidase CpaA